MRRITAFVFVFLCYLCCLLLNHSPRAYRKDFEQEATEETEESSNSRHEPKNGMWIEFVAVGTAVARRPPHGSRRAELPHRALALDHDGQTLVGIGMTDSREWKPVFDQLAHPFCGDASLLAPAVQGPVP